MGSRGDCFDNAVLESFHATIKKELIYRRSWPSKTEARTAVFDYIEAFYNRRRRHSQLGMLCPADFETNAQPQTNAHPVTAAASRAGAGAKNGKAVHNPSGCKQPRQQQPPVVST